MQTVNTDLPLRFIYLSGIGSFVWSFYSHGYHSDPPPLQPISLQRDHTELFFKTYLRYLYVHQLFVGLFAYSLCIDNNYLCTYVHFETVIMRLKKYYILLLLIPSNASSIAMYGTCISLLACCVIFYSFLRRSHKCDWLLNSREDVVVGRLSSVGYLWCAPFFTAREEIHYYRGSAGQYLFEIQIQREKETCFVLGGVPGGSHSLFLFILPLDLLWICREMFHRLST